MAIAYERISGDGKIAETPFGPIQYAEFGDGPPMLILHGSGGGYDQGKYFAELIGGDYKWIAPSRFGFLGSPVPKGADSVLQADIVASLLGVLGIGKVGVVGVSMGGPSSILFALRHKEKTNSLALISAASHAIGSRPVILEAVFRVFLNNYIFWSMVRLNPSILLSALGVPRIVQEELSTHEIARLYAFLHSINPMAARRNGQKLEQHMSDFNAEQACDISVPTQVLHARDDTLVPFEHAEFIERVVPGAELFPMEKGGHLALMIDGNADARRSLSVFLENHNYD